MAEKKPIAERIAELAADGLTKEEIATLLKAEGYAMKDIAKHLHVSIRTAGHGFKPKGRSGKSLQTTDPKTVARYAFFEEVVEDVRENALKRTQEYLNLGKTLSRYEHHARLDGKDLLSWIEDAIRFYLAWRGWLRVMSLRNRHLEKRVERLLEENRLLKEKLKALMILAKPEEEV